MARFYGEFIEDFPTIDAGRCKFRCYTSKIKPRGKVAYYRMFCQKSDKKCRPYAEESMPKETVTKVIPQRVSTKNGTAAWIFRVKKEDIKKETEKAVGVDLGTAKLVWIPKSVIKGWSFKPEGYIVEEWYAKANARTGGPFISIDGETKRALLESGHFVEK